MPTWFSALPVEILAWVRGSMSGLTRTDTAIVRPLAAAISASSVSSGSDSTLTQKMPCSTASAGAEPRQRRDHRLVGVRLERVADQRRQARKSLGEYPVVTLDRRGRIAIERGADRLGQGGDAHPLGVQHAVAIDEMVHGIQSGSASIGSRFLLPGGAIGRPSGPTAGASAASAPGGWLIAALGGKSSGPLHPKPVSPNARPPTTD